MTIDELIAQLDAMGYVVTKKPITTEKCLSCKQDVESTAIAKTADGKSYHWREVKDNKFITCFIGGTK